MMLSSNPQNEMLPVYSTELGHILKLLFDKGYNGVPGQIHINEILSSATRMNYDALFGALTILSTLGLIAVEQDNTIRTTSKYARFTIGSLSEFLERAVPIAKQADVNEEEQQYFASITSAMELMRRSKFGSSPIYFVEIVNVLIKGRQIRNWREEDVYLHVYHPKWKAYHLIGIGRRDSSESLDELAAKAMRVKLSIEPFQYELDTDINPPPIKYTDISGSHGALTEYKIHAKVCKHLKININNHLKNQSNGIAYRWFTVGEIQQGISRNQEAIMPSTPRLLGTINPKLISTSAGKVDHLGNRSNFLTDIGNMINGKYAIIYVGLTLSILVLPFIINKIFDLQSKSIPILENLANLSTIVALLLAFITLILGYNKST